ncbi:MAG: hypothetical protein FWH04_06155 [Oscillospiraceae bacterium]|nr:hypothetical protein [Oscillospiraceae bacterium]
MRISSQTMPPADTPAARKAAGKEKIPQADILSQQEDILEFSKRILSRTDEDKGMFYSRPEAAPHNTSSGSKVPDKSGALTRRLVSAKYQGEIRAILSEAFENLSDLITAAMSDDPAQSRAALAAIRRINKLISRSQRKISDLNQEDMTSQRQKNAEKKELEQLAKEIEAELKRKIIERKRREKMYLKDAKDSKEEPLGPITRLSRAEIEAQVQALALAKAQLQMMPSSLSAGPPVTDTPASASAAPGSAGAGEAGDGGLEAEG